MGSTVVSGLMVRNIAKSNQVGGYIPPMNRILNQLSKILNFCLSFSVGCPTVQVTYTVGQIIGVRSGGQKVVPLCATEQVPYNVKQYRCKL